MFLKLITPPTVEPLSIAEAKAFLRVDALDDDALIAALITATRQYAEVECQRALTTQSWQLLEDRFPECGKLMQLDINPVISVTGITYLDMGGAWQTMPSTDYVADLQSEPAKIGLAFGKIWPITMPQIASVKVNFTAGFGPTAADVPQGIKQWMLMRITTLYENRSEVLAIRGKLERMPFIDGLLDGFRVIT